MNGRALLITCGFFLLSLGFSFAANAKSATAGWAEVDITPPLGIALGGRGTGFIAAKEIIDPLFAQLLYLRDENGHGFVLVSFDLIGMPHDLSDKIRRSLVYELGVEWNLIILNCSHTHSGPNMIRDLLAGVEPAPQIEIDYFNSLHEKIITAARAAKKAMTPVTVQVFDGKSSFAINRRGKNPQDKTSILPDPNGAIDNNLWVMKVSPLDNSAPAIIFSYACHAVITYGYKFAAISADFPGATRNALRKQLGGKIHVQFAQGLAGDVRPRIVADIENKKFRASTAKDITNAGHDLANSIISTMKTSGETLELNIAGASDRPFLPRDKPPERAVYEKMAKDEKAKALHSVADYWLKRYDAGEGFAQGEAWPVGLIRLAKNQWIIHMAGEPCAEWREKFKQWLPGKKFVPFGYSGEANTYLPTEELLPLGGYEVLTCNQNRASSPAPFAPGIHDAVRKSLLRQLAFIESDVK